FEQLLWSAFVNSLCAIRTAVRGQRSEVGSQKSDLRLPTSGLCRLLAGAASVRTRPDEQTDAHHPALPDVAARLLAVAPDAIFQTQILAGGENPLLCHRRALGAAYHHFSEERRRRATVVRPPVGKTNRRCADGLPALLEQDVLA